ncbi:succinyl-diaminopimelate desuccinylase [Sulfolobus sp. A20]|uniref:M20 family metallopeptidase n=1 Tax=Saccharolobus sp. A20 TaxID=1891280 RepID=UPI000845C5E8|nr:M20 family metallopeptidase [Sulfolobus sp. A20]AOL16295.1 succinyl-diaminopimelate desuccinylase [Sulfolobus sp. A20]TRM86541.1 succinyl-diaminopimelate desuccinylase [Sulfolobus sp. E3]TRM89776.1 succinyl-diaminopimelate desuccinylase [Sulfolobus sp. C3]TRN04202.1 succinyl-diaminopimelate desuccinylase [Sulfolobus sp. E1]
MNDIIKLTSELIKIPSISGSNQKEISEFIKDWLNDYAGVKAKVNEFDPGWYTVVAEKGDGDNIIILNGHYDVVPPGDLKKWDTDPFSGYIKDNKVFGRGATDMKGGLAVLMKVFSEIDTKKYKIVFSAVPDEEIGGLHGSLKLAQIYDSNLVVIGEPSGSTSMTLAEKGLFQLKLKGFGRLAHGSLPSLGDNAILKVMRDLERLNTEINKINIDLPSDLEEIIKDTETIYNLPEVFKISFNPSVIKGGVKTNVVPDYCEIEIDMRIPPGISSNSLLDYVKNNVIKETIVEPIDLSDPNYTSPNDNYVKIFDKAIKEVIGVKAKKIIITGATDGRFFRYKGVPVIVYGPGELGVAHNYNEFVSFDELNRSYRVLKHFFELIND